ncbi:hypothetical protein ACE41H_21525 [Paenibacillus enshidis]|uniref:Uncharacterized protein n=1 Tax=Paenibacillus enshidis TaxID=1458439 RepID=A0ABV5AYR7_9BACL
MGYMTTLTILNDGFSQIQKYPKEFINKISEGMDGFNRFGLSGRNNINDYGIGNHANVLQVAQSHHADDPRMFVAYGNSLNFIGWGNDSTNLEHRKQMLKLAKQMVKREEEEIKRLENQQTKSDSQ